MLCTTPPPLGGDWRVSEYDGTDTYTSTYSSTYSNIHTNNSTQKGKNKHVYKYFIGCQSIFPIP